MKILTTLNICAISFNDITYTDIPYNDITYKWFYLWMTKLMSENKNNVITYSDTGITYSDNTSNDFTYNDNTYNT
jgi:hypothetical protein